MAANRELGGIRANWRGWNRPGYGFLPFCPLFPIEFPGKFAYAKDADEFVRQETPCTHRLAERGVGS
jgi:hypothetical protein